MTVLERAARMGRWDAGADLIRRRAGNMYGSGVLACSIICQKRALPSTVGSGGRGGSDWEGVGEVLRLGDEVEDVREVGVGAGASGGGDDSESEGFAAEAVRLDDFAPLSWSVGSESALSFLKDTGSPRRLGFFIAASFILPSPFL